MRRIHWLVFFIYNKIH